MSRVIYESEKRITCGFNGYPGHKGVDLGWRNDESQNQVYANCKGVVVEIQDGLGRLSGATGVKSWGNYVLIKHPNGMFTRYAHLQKGIKVKNGQSVDENTVLGIIGDSGNVTARHHHFEVATGYDSKTRIDPTPYLTKAVYEEKKVQSESAMKFKFNVGDKVIFNGTLYRDSKGNGAGQSRANYQATITKRVEGCKPYNLDNGLGWVSENDLKLASSSTAKKHTVKPGETVSSICRTYYSKSTKTEWDKIKNANSLNDSYLIRVGQILIIP